jgi:signal peptidase II
MKKLLPFSLTAFIILADQIVKNFIANTWSIAPGSGGVFIKDVFEDVFEDGPEWTHNLVWIIHVRNKAIAFSVGQDLPETMRPLLFIVLPLVVLGIVVWYYFKSSDFRPIQRWMVAGIIGGGLGNIADRIFRPDGVIDFISVRFFGIFGLPRWPTFNIADASVVICCVVLLFSIIFTPKSKERK